MKNQTIIHEVLCPICRAFVVPGDKCKGTKNCPHDPIVVTGETPALPAPIKADRAALAKDKAWASALKESQDERYGQRQWAGELKASMGFADSFSNRANRDDCPELFGNYTCLSDLPVLIRMDMESSDVYIEVNDTIDEELYAERLFELMRAEGVEHMDQLEPEEQDALRELAEIHATLHYQVTKVVAKRDPEFQAQQGLDKPDAVETIDGEEVELPYEDDFFEEPEAECAEDMVDALDYADEAVEGLPAAPKEKYDLIWDANGNGGTGYSADVFPRMRDKRLKGYATNLAKAIAQGRMPGYALHKAIADGLKRGSLAKEYKGRLWDLHFMQSANLAAVAVARFLRATA